MLARLSAASRPKKPPRTLASLCGVRSPDVGSAQSQVPRADACAEFGPRDAARPVGLACHVAQRGHDQTLVATSSRRAELLMGPRKDAQDVTLRGLRTGPDHAGSTHAVLDDHRLAQAFTQRERCCQQQLLRLTHSALQAVFSHRHAKGFLEDGLELVLVGADFTRQLGEQWWPPETALQPGQCGMRQVHVALPVQRGAAQQRHMLHRVKGVGHQFSQTAGILKHPHLAF
jgi:hypothetical protein